MDNNEILKELCIEYGVILNENYDDIKISYRSIIKIKCIKCYSNTEKNFNL